MACSCMSCKSPCTPRDVVTSCIYLTCASLSSGPTEYRNPCTPEAIAAGHVMFAYPYDSSKFVRCDYRGDAYVTLCPHRWVLGSHRIPLVLNAQSIAKDHLREVLL